MTDYIDRPSVGANDPLPPSNIPGAWFYISHLNWNIFVDEDNYGQGKIKKTIYAVKQNSPESFIVDISPYSQLDPSLIKRVIDSGFPNRINALPLSHSILNTIESCSQAAE